jgi:hypothetical protein
MDKMFGHQRSKTRFQRSIVIESERAATGLILRVEANNHEAFQPRNWEAGNKVPCMR